MRGFVFHLEYFPNENVGFEYKSCVSCSLRGFLSDWPKTWFSICVRTQMGEAINLNIVVMLVAGCDSVFFHSPDRANGGTL